MQLATQKKQPVKTKTQNYETDMDRDYDNIEEGEEGTKEGAYANTKSSKDNREDGYDYGSSGNESDDQIPNNGYIHPSQIGPRPRRKENLNNMTLYS